MRNLISAIAISSVLAGCSSVPTDVDKALPKRDEIKRDIVTNFNEIIPAIRKVRVSGDLFVSKVSATPIPFNVKNKNVSFDLNGTDGTLGDLALALEAFYGFELSEHWQTSATYKSKKQGASGAQNRQMIAQSPVNPQVPGPKKSDSKSKNMNNSEGGLKEEPEEKGVFSKKVPFLSYDGKLSGLLNKLSSTMNLEFWYENGNYFVSDLVTYTVAIPHRDELPSTVAEELQKLGAKDILASEISSTITYTSIPQVNNNIIKPYLKRVSSNVSSVSIQVALVSVIMTEENERGFDWNALRFNFGENALSAATGGLNNGINNVANGIGSAIGGTNDALTGASGSNGSAGISISANGQEYKFNSVNLFGRKRPMSVNTAIKYLSSFGRARIDQDAEVRTLAGTEVVLKNGEKIPFVSGVGSAALGGGVFNGGSQQQGGTVGNGGTVGGATNQGGQGGVTNNNFSSGVLGQASTQSIDTGIEAIMTPYFDASSGIVTIKVDLKVNDLVAFVELNAGNQIGTLTQPRTRGQEFTDVVRVPAGQTVVIGGLRRTMLNKNNSAPLKMYDLGNSSISEESSSLYVILRPSVTFYEYEDSTVESPKSSVVEAIMTDGTLVKINKDGRYEKVTQTNK